MNYFKKIEQLKKEKNAVILAHYYQNSDIQDVADFIGDSLALAEKATATEAEIIVMTGVVFMGETVKILNPEKKVLVPDLEAGCSLADGCEAKNFRDFIKYYPNHLKITYINCSAEVKALSDIVCTSSNALEIIKAIPYDQPILFAPDRNLGKYLIRASGREMVLWDGSCFIHETFLEQKIKELKELNPGSKIIAHPECAEAVINIADYIGSTSALLSFSIKDTSPTFIVVTEAGIIHQMKKAAPEKNFIPAPPSTINSCNCGECPHMKLNSLEKLYGALESEKPEICLDEEIRKKALIPIKRMFELTGKHLCMQTS